MIIALFLLQSLATAGNVQGVVVDRSNSAVAGASVTVKSEASNQSRETVSNGTGQFVIPGLAPGEYRLTVSMAGFATGSVGPFSVTVGQTVVHRVVLALADLQQTLEVNDSPEALQTTAVTSSTGLGNDRIEETPAAGRNYLNFVLTAPGVAASAGSNARRSAASQRSPVGDSGFTFAGMRPRNNSLSIDGTDNRDETTGGSRVAVGLEMVAEFRVSGTETNAEFGNGAGGSVNVVTRSGTNLWHGDFTYFGQNEVTNARNPEVKAADKQRFRRYQPGVSINGPVKRDRTFFSTAWEQQWEQSEEWSDTPTSLVVSKGLQRGLFPARENQSEVSFKGNHIQSQRSSYSIRYAFSRGRVLNDVQDVDNFTDRSARGSSYTGDQSLVGGWTFVPNQRLISDLRVQWARRVNELTPNSRDPLREIPGIVSFGQSWRLDADRSERHLEAVEGLTILKGQHQITLGGSVQEVALRARIANRFGGVEVYPTLADYMVGRIGFVLKAEGDPATRLTTVPVGTWVQDRWQPRGGLTVDVGLRYDYQTLPSSFRNSRLNFAPRLGIAWQPGARWVVRGAAGLFFDRPPLIFVNEAIQKDGVHGWETYRIGGLTTRSVYRPDATFPSTYSRKLSAGVERAINRDTTLTTEYSWVAGYHLPRTRNAAVGLPAVFQLEQSARSDYQGGSVSLNRRMSKEVSYLVAWSFGRTYDDGSDFDEQPRDPANVRAEWARSRQHQLHRVAASALFELPEVDALPKIIREGLEEITVAPILTAGTGRPLNALYTTDYYRTGAFPMSARPFGLGRNPFYTPGQFSLDLRVMKTFPIHENRARLQIGVESFNLTNHSNPLRVSPYYMTPGGTKLNSYCGVVETLNARQVQFLMQFEY